MMFHNHSHRALPDPPHRDLGILIHVERQVQAHGRYDWGDVATAGQVAASLNRRGNVHVTRRGALLLATDDDD